MRAEIVGIPPVPTGLTWVDGKVEFSFDPNWSDGAGRGPGTISGVLHPTTKDKFVVPGSNGALFVPATPTGVGVIRGPLMTVRWWLIDSQGREYRLESVFTDSLLADASNQWNVNSIGAAPTYVTSPGPAPVGVDIATGDARYVRFTSLATTSAVGVVQLATGAEAVALTDATKAITPSTLKSALDSRFALANVAALQAITLAQRTAGFTVAQVTGIGVYVFDTANTRASFSNKVLRPADIGSDASPGRWILAGPTAGLAAPAAPTIGNVAGVSGVPALTAATPLGGTPDTFAFFLNYSVTPGAAGTMQIGVTPPAGWAIAALTIGCTNSGSGAPQVSATINGGGVITFASIASHQLNAYVTLIRS